MIAKFYDGRSAHRISVQVDVLSDRIVFRKSEDTGVYDWFFRDLEAEKLSESVMTIRNRLIPDARLEIENAQAVRELQKKLKFRAAVMWTEDSKVFVAVLAFFLGALGIIFLFLDTWTDALVTWIPQKVEKQIFGDYASLLKKMQCDSPLAEAVVDSLAKKLMSPEEVKNIDIFIVDENQVNAFAIPGGTVIVNVGLLREVRHSDELAGVLAHELEHQAQRHIAKNLVKNSFVTTLGGLLAGKAGDLAGALTGLKFSRDFETQADQGAAIRLDRAGISRIGMIHFLKRLSEMTNVPQLLSTHPMEGREAQLMDGYDATKKLPASLSDADFKILKSAKCK